MRYDKSITLQKQDETTEQWADWLSKPLHARVNKTGGGQGMQAGADQFRATLTFELRYFAALEELRYDSQLFRIMYQGRAFKVVDYDDYQEQHRTVKLVGEYYE